MRHRVVGFGPSLVDIGAKLPEKVYNDCCEILDAEPGDWRRIENPEQANKLLQAISGAAIQGVSFIDSIHSNPNTTVTPGSSIFGMLGAMAPDMRSGATFVSTLATQRGMIDPMSLFFSGAIHAAGIDHRYEEVDGYNPMGFVLSSTSDTEKILGMYPGVAAELADHDLESLNPDLVILDTYELLEGKMAQYLDKTIDSGDYRIALSLGNHSIIEGETKNRIRKYIAMGRIGILSGNSLEYQTLFSELEPGLATKEGFRAHPIRDHVPFALMTMGEKGSVAAWNNEVVESGPPSIHPAQIVNTSGAGDVTAGVFYSGVLRGDDAKETLRKAAFYANRVLRVPGSMVLAQDRPVEIA